MCVCVSCYELAPLIYSALVNSLIFPLPIAFSFCENNFTTIDLYNGLKVVSPLRPRLRMTLIEMYRFVMHVYITMPDYQVIEHKNSRRVNT